MKTKTINKAKALILTFTILMAVLIANLKVSAAEATASLNTDQVSPNQNVTLTLNISGEDFASIGISVEGVENAKLTSGPNSNVYQEGNTLNITTDLANNSSTSHTYVLNLSYSSQGSKPIKIVYDIISADLNRTVVNKAFTVTVSAPTPKATPTPAPKATPTPKPSPTPKKPGNNTTATTKAKPSSKAENNNNYKRINKKMVVTTDLDIRSNASLSSAYLGFYDKGTVVDVIGVTDDGWYVVNYNGKTAYLAGSYLNDYHASTPNSTKANNNNSNSEKTTSSKKNDESNASTTKKDDKTKKTTKTAKTNTSKTSTSGTTTEKSDSGLIIGTSDSNTNTKIANNKIKSLFAKLDPTMIIVFALIILLIILMIIYYILKKKILEDEEQDEFEELPSDNDEAIYANKSSKIEVSRVDDSENPKNNTEN